LNCSVGKYQTVHNTGDKEIPFDEIESKEFRPITTIFTRGNWNDFYDCYKPYICDKCNRFDWLKATQNGIHATPKLPVRMPDFFQTSTFRSFVVSVNTKKAFETFSGEIAEFFPIPKIKDYYVLLPKQLLLRPDKITGRLIGNKTCRCYLS
jgi:hypothetical protein